MGKVVSGSFRDPFGFLFLHDHVLYRQINNSYKRDYDALIKSGLYQKLIDKRLLIPHQQVDIGFSLTDDAYKVIKPDYIKSISYPYEWSFSQLKDAALLTLEIQQQALKKSFSLKDASAYNVQFYKGRPIFIDTLSFEKLPEGMPWVAYRQFCQHFLAPLALMAKTDVSLSQLLRTNIDGVPLGLASKLLPISTKFNFSLGIHIHLHARSQSKNADIGIDKQKIKGRFTKKSFLALIDNLKSTIKKLRWEPTGTEWYDYYDVNNNYTHDSLSSKEKIVKDFVKSHSPSLTWDLGANTGKFSRIASEVSGYVCAWDIDPACVEANYRAIKRNQEKTVLPLLLDLTNPSPSIGWNNEERMSFPDRGPVDLILALGLVHHLAISNNLPLEKIAKFFSNLTNILIVEFVPKSDSQVKKLLSTRKDIFPLYEKKNFEVIFTKYFSLVEMRSIPGSERTLYHMKRV